MSSAEQLSRHLAARQVVDDEAAHEGESGSAPTQDLHRAANAFYRHSMPRELLRPRSAHHGHCITL